MEQPRRSRFQVHLSTAIVLMFVVGGLMWVNATPRTIVWVDSLGSLNVIRRKMYGWPVGWVTRYEYMGVKAHYDTNFEVTFPVLPIECNSSSLEIERMQLLLDATLIALLLVVIWHVCEWFIRHRASAKAR
jgi:hypothetical protein